MRTENVEVEERAGEPAAPKRKRLGLSRQTKERVISITSPLLLLVLWEIAVRFGLLDARFFPAPTSIASTFVSLVQSGELWANTWISLQRLFLGFLLGGTPALILGIIMGLYRPIRLAIDPLIAATYPIPKSALLPLILLIFGLGEPSKIVMVAIGVFFPVVINTIAGVVAIDRIYHDVGKNFGANGWQMFYTVALPGAMPLVMTGIKLGVGMGLILIAIAEMVGAKSGLGFMIWNAWQIFSVETMYVGLVVIAVLGVLFTFILNELERVLIPWRSDQ